MVLSGSSCGVYICVTRFFFVMPNVKCCLNCKTFLFLNGCFVGVFVIVAVFNEDMSRCFKQLRAQSFCFCCHFIIKLFCIKAQHMDTFNKDNMVTAIMLNCLKKEVEKCKPGQQFFDLLISERQSSCVSCNYQLLHPSKITRCWLSSSSSLFESRSVLQSDEI